MTSFLRWLFSERRRPVSARASITPGRLYAMMSREFRSVRSSHPCCTMPLPYTCDRPDPQSCNWRIQSLVSECEGCGRLAVQIAEKYAALYDVRDPFWVGPGSAIVDEELEHPQFG